MLQKAPFLLQYELQTTERFIRKHIGDYSGYYHRQFILYKMNELKYFEHEPNNESNLIQYMPLINYLASIGSMDAQMLRTQLPTQIDSPTQSQPIQIANGHYHLPAWKILMKIVLPQRDYDSADNDKIRIKSLLYCMNVAAYDLKFTSELQEMFGYREAFQCHRRAIKGFLEERCTDWAVAPFLRSAVSKSN